MLCSSSKLKVPRCRKCWSSYKIGECLCLAIQQVFLSSFNAPSLILVWVCLADILRCYIQEDISSIKSCFTVFSWKNQAQFTKADPISPAFRLAVCLYQLSLTRHLRLHRKLKNCHKTLWLRDYACSVLNILSLNFFQWIKLRLCPVFASAEVFRIAIKQHWTMKEKTPLNEKPLGLNYGIPCNWNNILRSRLTN